MKSMSYEAIQTMPVMERGFYLKRLLQQLKKENKAAKGK
jgi:hypothetical protein